jgi:hypothetical protein
MPTVVMGDQRRERMFVIFVERNVQIRMHYKVISVLYMWLKNCSIAVYARNHLNGL